MKITLTLSNTAHSTLLHWVITRTSPVVLTRLSASSLKEFLGTALCSSLHENVLRNMSARTPAVKDPTKTENIIVNLAVGEISVTMVQDLHLRLHRVRLQLKHSQDHPGSH